ncbi:MAG: 30S ribosomal protein S16 [Crocinitomicaceae bacterium]
MATRIRLQRHGKKKHPFYHIVIADARAKRDGKFIEKIGTYNPNTNPATIDLNFDSALTWVRTGAEMSDTARAILSYKGVLYKNHLINGVAKGALTEADVETKFNNWLEQKEGKIDAKKSGLSKAQSDASASALAREQAANKAKAEAVAFKNTPAPEVEEAPEVAETETPEDAPEASVEETPEASVEETPEAPAEETPEASAE